MKKQLAIIDSGYDIHGKNSDKVDVIEISLLENGNYLYRETKGDEIGHGTALVDRIVEKTNENFSIYMIKIFSTNQIADSDILVEALGYCYKNINPNILVISLGVRETSFRMHKYIKQLSESGTIIVSAFDNMKCLSYPAAFTEVIGVDISEKYSLEGEYDVYYGDGIVDVCGADVFYHLNWINSSRIILRGSSFFVADIVAKIIDEKRKLESKKDVLKVLEREAVNIYKCKKKIKIDEKTFIASIKKAVVLPLNKEVFSLAAFEDLCDFEIVDYYDIKYGMNVGKRIIDIKPYTGNEKVVKDIEKINWLDDFDTVICGHLGKASLYLKKNFLNELIDCCVKYRKKLYTFDGFLLKKRKTNFVFGKEYLFPFNYSNPAIHYRNGKMCLNSTPTVLVVGTSSKQGKYTVQLNLIRYLRNKKINVGAIGSEPSALLFGFEEYLSYGYNNNCMLNDEEIPLVVNEYVRKFQEEKKDLILLGEQSGVIPYQMLNTEMYSLKQMGILLGLSPDSFILCVNKYDDKKFVMRCIKYVESLTCAKLLCIVRSETLNDDLISNHSWGEIPGIDIFELSDKNLSRKLGETVINFYINSTDL